MAWHGARGSRLAKTFAPQININRLPEQGETQHGTGTGSQVLFASYCTRTEMREAGGCGVGVGTRAQASDAL